MPPLLHFHFHRIIDQHFGITIQVILYYTHPHTVICVHQLKVFCHFCQPFIQMHISDALCEMWIMSKSKSKSRDTPSQTLNRNDWGTVVFIRRRIQVSQSFEKLETNSSSERKVNTPERDQIFYQVITSGVSQVQSLRAWNSRDRASRKKSAICQT